MFGSLRCIIQLRLHADTCTVFNELKVGVASGELVTVVTVPGQTMAC